jgi:hypothetical protein
MADPTPAAAPTTLGVLQSIDATLKLILARFPAPPPTVADDADLDGQYGNPVIQQKDPKDWKGDTMKDRRYSECPPEYLDLVASRLDYFAEVAEREGKVTSNGKPVAPFNRRDAARARGWAKRLRAGWKPAADGGFDPDPVQATLPAAAGGFPSDVAEVPDDEIPF